MDNKDNKNRMTKKIIKSNKIPITIIENRSKEDIIWVKLKSIVCLFKKVRYIKYILLITINFMLSIVKTYV